MQGVNKVILVGNLGKDPEVRNLESGAKVASFSLATTESYKDRNTGERVDKTEWHNIVLWRGLADVAERFCKKGSQIYLEGKLQTRNYEGQDGITRYTTEIVGQQMTLLGRPADAGQNNAPYASAQPSAQPAAAPVQTPTTSQPAAPLATDLKMDEGEDDLPF